MRKSGDLRPKIDDMLLHFQLKYLILLRNQQHLERDLLNIVEIDHYIFELLLPQVAVLHRRLEYPIADLIFNIDCLLKGIHKQLLLIVRNRQILHVSGPSHRCDHANPAETLYDLLRLRRIRLEYYHSTLIRTHSDLEYFLLLAVPSIHHQNIFLEQATTIGQTQLFDMIGDLVARLRQQKQRVLMPNFL